MCCCGSTCAAAARAAGAARSPRRRSRSPACPTRRSSASMRSRARPGGCWSRTAGCWNGARRATRTRAHGRAAATDLAALVSRRCGSPRRSPPRAALALALSAPAGAGRRPRPILLPLARLARRRLVDQPAARPPRGAADAASRPASCASSRAGPGRSSRPSSARRTTGCRRTTIQEHPVAVVAHRTSPTNMGLSLLANLAAYDFGYIPAGQLVERTANALRTMEALERYRGPLLQLVRHADAAAAAAALRLDGGQRQPRRPPADAARRACWRCPTSRIVEPRVVRRACATRCASSPTPPADAAPAQLAQLRADAGRRAVDARRPRDGAATLAASALAASRRWRRAVAADCAGGREAARLGASARAAVPARAATSSRCSRRGSRCRRRRAALARLRGCDAIPTLRELAALDASCCRRSTARRDAGAGAARDGSTRCEARRRGAAARAERIAAIEQLALQAGELARDGLRLPLRPRRATCWRSATTSTSAGATRATTTCSPRKRGSASFVAIAQGQLPQENWFALGRLLTTAGGEPVLLSWSGSMFEYLMPLLVMPTYENTLLDQTCRAAVRAADRVRQAARRALGHLGVRLQHGRRAASTTSTAPSACPAWG